MGNAPEQVRRQAERANQLLNQAHGTPGAPEELESEAPADQAPTIAQPAEPPVDTQPPVAPAEPTEPPAPAPPTEGWEHKYKTLQGVLNAESGRWAAERKVLEDRLKAKDEATPPAPPAAPQPSQALVTDKDLETYGPELVDLIGRKAQEIANDIVAKRMQELKPELDKTREQVTNVTQQVYRSNEERFYGELAKAIPDWQAVNSDPRWLEWLGESDPLSGIPRQQFLNQASQQLDSKRAAVMFNAFKDFAGLNAPAPTPTPAPVKPTLSPTPRTVGTASAPTHREPATGVSRLEIGAHYRRGSTDPSYRTSDEHKAMETRIAEAMATGNIIEA